MQTKIDEIARDVFRLSTCVPDAAPGGFTFNQFLLRADAPLLFHTGPRRMLPLVSEAIGKLIPIASLRYLAFGHVESDECGAMNELLALAPGAEVVHGALGCMVSLDDLSDRTPRRMADGEVLDLGGLRVRHIDTPHVPHNWEARVLFEESSRTLFCGDLLSQTGNGPALSDEDLVPLALGTEDVFGSTALAGSTAPTIRRLADLDPQTLAIMHGSSTAIRCAETLRRLADAYAERLQRDARRAA
ncbi:MAG: MBL fold metallo-hydrolase [Deltaproteobacteria bacterium]|nr:MBL fold metallo-hydrolase [Deltaproteobacteria bacterium]